MNAKLARRFDKRSDTSREGYFAMGTAASIGALVFDKPVKHWKTIQRETMRWVG